MRRALRVGAAAAEVLAPLAAIGWGVAGLWGGPAAALAVGGLLWVRYMADVVRGR